MLYVWQLVSSYDRRKALKKINKAIGRIAKKVTDSFIGSGLSQDMTIPEGQRYITPGMPEMVRKTGAESCVLLKNDGVLPLDAGNTVAVFGRCQLDWFYVGYGSGGDVHAPYKINLIDGLKNVGARLDEELAAKYYEWTHEKDNLADDGWWGHWPFSYPEMPVSPELAQQAAGRARTAVVVIGRAAGEDRENTLTKGSYYLTDLETGMLDAVTSAFEKTVVLMNTGNITDMSWTEKYGDRISAVMIVWQGGMESGNAVADVLFGKVSPSGKLPDSIARYYEDYPSSANFGGKEYNDYDEDIFVGYRYFGDHPEKLLWPFGYGLSYSNFEIKPVIFSRGTAEVSVRNTGGHSGKEVVQLWCAQPPGRLPKAKKNTCCLRKDAGACAW